ncbi:MAG: phage tail sheath family protein [Burkholderiales bacterium]
MIREIVAMPEYLHPGVYIEGIDRGPRPIEGVPTSTAAFLGETERGPITPRLVTSYQEYQRWFGGIFGSDKFMPYSVDGFFENGGARLYICRLVDDTATAAEAAFGNFHVQANGPGSWGRRVWARIDDGSTKRPDAAGVVVPIGFRLRVAYWASSPPFDWIAEDQRQPLPTVFEDFDDLVTDERSPDYYGRRLLDSSALVTLVPSEAASTDERPTNDTLPLSSKGGDGSEALDVADYRGLPNNDRVEPQGLSALELAPYQDVSLVYAPNAKADVAKAVITHCEKLRYRFAVIECPQDATPTADPRATIADTQFGAFYFPWIVVSDPQTGARKVVPPGGHVLGVYARSDSERGVFKAPANATLRGALALLTDIDDAMQDQLNQRGVNVIREFPGRGIRVWGARTMSSDTLWKYVSVRRLFIFLERSIYAGTQWTVFEPNDRRLWAAVVDAIRIFLRGQWRQGALFGRTEEQAFYAICNETTMTPDDILNGRLICEIGVAPVRPAEFVIFRIFQDTTEARR